MASRGIRNNNPGNIDFNTHNFACDPWMGEVGIEKHVRPRFTTFEDPVYGIRAMAKILLTYQNKYNLDTVEKMIHRWAPPSENKVASYAEHVAERMGCGAKEPIDLAEDTARFQLMVAAMIKHENGDQPYSPETIDSGLKMALSKPRISTSFTDTTGDAA